jgi:DNA-binding SARP family transcriptional activator
MSSLSPPIQQSVWKLELFGRGQLVGNDLTVQLERKTAALYGFLALEGATSRSALAGLLWADSTEESARNSLRQRFYRLRNSIGYDFIVSTEPLRLDPSLEVDVVRFESLMFTGEFTSALAFEGAFLESVDFDDCPELNEWVLAARERLEAGKREALIGEATRLEKAGDYAAALGRAKQVLLRDPISEDAHRRLMRLHYLAGDRPAAIRAFEQCQTTLETELGVKPLFETLLLSNLIFKGETLPQTVPPERLGIPIQILRPPVLVDRAQEWAQLEAAWATGSGVIVRGEAGVGKTRLIQDFYLSKGAFVLLDGRPGDKGIGYATLSRGLKRIFEQHENLKLEPWVRRELSRVVPNLEAEPPSAIQSDPEKIRFFSSVLELFKELGTRGARTIVVDDLQFMDAASVELWQFIATSEMSLPLCTVYRRFELETELESNLLQTKHALIELLPLGSNGLNQLLSHLEIPDVTGLAVSLEQYTGGNPMYVLETIKNLLETGGIARGLPQHFPPPQKIGALIRHRLERLSSSALRLARVAAVAGTDFSLSLAISILELNALELSEPLLELEKAQVLIGERFAHDLIFETTREGVPNTIKILLHRRIAEYLETVNAAPARIAHHWLEVGDQEQAGRYGVEAATQQWQQGLIEIGLRTLDDLLLLKTSDDLKSIILANRAVQRVRSGRLIESQADCVMVLQMQKASWFAKATAYSALVEVRYNQGRFDEVIHLTQLGRDATAHLDDASINNPGGFTDTWNYFDAYTAYSQERYKDALGILEPMSRRYANIAHQMDQLSILSSIETCLFKLGDHGRARAINREIYTIAQNLDNSYYKIVATSSFLQMIPDDQELQQAITDAEHLLTLEPVLHTSYLRLNLVSIFETLKQYERGIVHLEQALNSTEVVFHAIVLARLATLYHFTGNAELAQKNLRFAFASQSEDQSPAYRYELARAFLLITPRVLPENAIHLFRSLSDSPPLSAEKRLKLNILLQEYVTGSPDPNFLEAARVAGLLIPE